MITPIPGHPILDEAARIVYELPANKRAQAERAWQDAMTWLEREYPEIARLIVPREHAELRFYRSLPAIAHKEWTGHESELVCEAKLCLLIEHRLFQEVLRREKTRQDA